MNLGGYLTRSATFWPEREALVCGAARWNYRRLEAEANRLASALLRTGIAPGQAVATFAANCGELVVTEMALSKGGFVRVPINARLAGGELAHVLRDADVRVLFVDTDHAAAALAAVAAAGIDCAVFDYAGAAADAGNYGKLLDQGSDKPISVDVDENHPAVLNYTSGSTGSLKAAVQTTGNRLANMRKRLMSPGSAPHLNERYLAPGPITHASGMVLLAVLSRGGAVVILPAFETGTFLRTIETERVTATFVVPTMLNMLMQHPAITEVDLSSLTCLGVGGAPVSPQRLRDAVAVFGPIVMQGYGLGETTSGITILTAEDVVRGIDSDPELLSSCGRPVFDTEVRVVDDAGIPVPAGEIGEIVARGPDCVREYWHEPELSAETFRDGWVYTGDVGYFRHDGYLFIVDRKKDMIISGGFNIYCSEVEAVLYEHPAVAEVCVVGVPDEQWGEAVKAVVVARAGTDPSESELIEHCAARLARMKKPQSVDFVATLPVNRNGKLDRRAVRAPYWAATARGVN
ncbi:AMP-binding protein [Nocardia goodfellowii]|uniref:Acyl-CoA synthetase (AMP-forming)/AMP-acid ligase II n=1 Tax=Nocardia goodfellowii TaxID=882446 RepID=A0ABS4QL47_9NOCA|nr:AMP-binding protein [Nocardia goodfellowii]MBP2192437.1 acyl-CoA synthetase (AMP-forming)/AMP-acid ligase II [Nocardia goodfellowii]